jgi:hypothetical protein
MCVHIIPRSSVLLAARSVDVPTVDEIAYKKSTLASQLLEEFHDGMQNLELPASPSPDSDPIQILNEYVDSLSDVRESKMYELSSRLKEERHNRQKVQENLAFALARISPVTSFSLSTSHLSGTSIKLKDRFYEEALEFQRPFGSFIKEKTGLNLGGSMKIRASASCSGGGDEEEEKPEQIDPAELPDFGFTNQNLNESLEASIVDLGILSLFNILFFTGAFVSFIRYDVR